VNRRRVEQRARASEDARKASRDVLTRLYVLADQLVGLGEDLRTEVERRKEREAHE
jgi:hypothetical protein